MVNFKEIWYTGLRKVSKMNEYLIALIIMSFLFFIPVGSIIYIAAPKSKVIKKLFLPLLCLLCCLIFNIFKDWKIYAFTMYKVYNVHSIVHHISGAFNCGKLEV